ncbi:MAG: hypothetical protein PHI49_10660, partial [Halothiobacillaceae bacterium]|nr:hypothetical protein [Halothiobacillaceae bacterium]
MSYANAQEAISALSGTNATQADIIAFVRQLSVEASGTTTVLYSGDINGTPSWQIVDELPADVRHIGKTMAKTVLDSDEFKAKVAQAFGLTPLEFQNELLDRNSTHPAKVWLNKGGTGPWATASEMFVEATRGEVRLLTLGPAADSVLWRNEIPKLLDKLQNSSDITAIDGIGRDDLLKIGASYSTGWTDAMRTSLINTAITQTHFSKPGLSSYGSWLNITPNSLKGLYESATATELKAWSDLLSGFEVPRGATRALSKLGVFGGIVGFGLMSTQAGAAELAGDHEGAKQIVIEWGLDVTGSSSGQVLGAAVGAAALTALAGVGVAFSAPAAGVFVLGAALLGGIFGADVAKELYELTKNRSENGKLDLFDRITDLVFGESYNLSSIQANLAAANGWHYTMAFNVAELANNALTDVAWRYALHKLNPFVVPEVDYSTKNPNGELDLYNPTTGTGQITEQWIRDRAEMLQFKNLYDTRDMAYGERFNYLGGVFPTPVDGDYIYHDIASGIRLDIDGVNPTTLASHQIVFGGNGADSVSGGSVEDHLYGGAGADVLDGKGGNDYLEGGEGKDTYRLRLGEGVDTIMDTDGQGVVEVD